MLHRPHGSLSLYTCQCSVHDLLYAFPGQGRARPMHDVRLSVPCPFAWTGTCTSTSTLRRADHGLGMGMATPGIPVVHCLYYPESAVAKPTHAQSVINYLCHAPCCQCQVLLICPCQTTLTSSLVPRYAMCAACRESIVCMRWYIIVHGTSCITMHAWYSASASSTSSHHQSGHGTGSASGRSTQCRST
eukprot:scpid104072/ scgid2645/ 